MSPRSRTSVPARLAVRLAGASVADAFALTTAPSDAGAVLVRGQSLPGLDLAGVDVAAALSRESAKGEPGEVVSVPLPSGATLFLVGVGSGHVPALRRAAAALVRRARSVNGTLATTLAWSASADAVRAVPESLVLASYSFSLRSESKPATLLAVELAARRPEVAQAGIDRGLATALATVLARDLINMPSEEKTPAWLATQAQRSVGPAVEVVVRDENALLVEG